MDTANLIKSLSDNQLGELFKTCVAEVLERGSDLEAYLREVALTADEKASATQRALTAFEHEQRAKNVLRTELEVKRKLELAAQHDEDLKIKERNRLLWLRKKSEADLIKSIFPYKGVVLSVWMKNADKRVYVEAPFDKKKWCVYVTGNKNKPPGKVDSFGEILSVKQVQTLLGIGERWNKLKINIDELC